MDTLTPKMISIRIDSSLLQTIKRVKKALASNVKLKRLSDVIAYVFEAYEAGTTSTPATRNNLVLEQLRAEIYENLNKIQALLVEQDEERVKQLIIHKDSLVSSANVQGSSE